MYVSLVVALAALFASFSFAVLDSRVVDAMDRYAVVYPGEEAYLTKMRDLLTALDASPKVAKVSSDFKFSSSVAWFGLVLRDSKLIKKKSLSDIRNLAAQNKGKDEEGYRAEFISLVEKYKASKK